MSVPLEKIGIVIQARMGSTRLPGKMMKPLCGRPVLEHVIERLRDCKQAGQLVIATTTLAEDNEICKLAEQLECRYFRGNAENVLERYYRTAVAFSLEVIVRVSSDCPLTDPEIVDQMIQEFLQQAEKGQRWDYYSNALTKRTFPIGFETEVFWFDVLERAYREATTADEREHVTLYIKRHPKQFTQASFELPESYSHYWLTLDTADDYRVLAAVFEHLYPENPKFRLSDVLELVKEEYPFNGPQADTQELTRRYPPYLAGEKIYLTPFTREHLEASEYSEWLNDLETTKHLGGGPDYLMPVSFEQLEAYFQRNAFDRDNIFFAVVEKSSDRFIGTLRVSHINWVTRTAELGIMIGDKCARGRGYASEMVELAARYAFDVLNMRKLVAGAHVANPASARCFERLGFRQEGVLRDHVFIDGKYYDAVRYALFEHEYRQQRASANDTRQIAEESSEVQNTRGTSTQATRKETGDGTGHTA